MSAHCWCKLVLLKICGIHHSLQSATLHMEFLANCFAELTLLEYDFLKYLPSMIAGSAVFLAKFTLDPNAKPWVCDLWSKVLCLMWPNVRGDLWQIKIVWIWDVSCRILHCNIIQGISPRSWRIVFKLFMLYKTQPIVHYMLSGRSIDSIRLFIYSSLNANNHL